MALTSVDKLKIHQHLKEHAVNDIYYLDMCDAIGKRGKITDIEFLEYFTDYTIQEFSKEGKISIKHITKVINTIEAFLCWLNEAKTTVKEETLDKIRSFPKFYEEYLEKNQEEANLDFKETCLDSIIKLMDEIHPATVDTESITKYFKQINELTKTVKSLQKQLEEIEAQYNSSIATIDQKNERIDTLNRNLTTSNNESKEKDKKIKELQEQIDSLTTKISQLEINLETITKENLSLLHYKEQFETLTEEAERLRLIIEETTKAKKKQEKQEKRETKLEALIYQKLLFERESIDSLLTHLEGQGLISTKQEIASLLKRIKTKINVETTSFSTSPTYKIMPPFVQRNSKFNINIPLGSKVFDILLVSDFHLETFDHKTISGFEMMHDYCSKSGINLILNLGDFFHGTTGKPLEYDNAKDNYHIVEEAISKIPQTDGVYHAILGGNHDKSITKYGFDPLQLLADEREDFISLGYKHSTINLTTPTRTICSFDLHHPDNFDFPIDLEESSFNTEELDNYLNDIYSKQGRSRDDSYIDIIGHTHKSQFNFPNSYCYIPAFFEGKTKRGAWHLKIYFDENTDIECMAFMPLSVTTKLVKNNELIYQKVLKK